MRVHWKVTSSWVFLVYISSSFSPVSWFSRSPMERLIAPRTPRSRAESASTTICRFLSVSYLPQPRGKGGIWYFISYKTEDEATYWKCNLLCNILYSKCKKQKMCWFTHHILQLKIFSCELGVVHIQTEPSCLHKTTVFLEKWECVVNQGMIFWYPGPQNQS